MGNINFKGDSPIDYAGVHVILDNMEDDCRVCNQAKRKEEGILCDRCCMRSNSTYVRKTGEKRSRVCPSTKVFKHFGLINLAAMGKHMFFYFLDNPWLDFTYPELPDEDLFGQVSKEKAIELGLDPKEYGRDFLWHIHHGNREYWNDSKWNLLLCLNTEHMAFDTMYTIKD